MDENGGGPPAVATTGRRRQTLLDQMSAVDNGNDAVSRTEKRHPPLALTPTPAQVNRTLLDIIRDEERGSLFGHNNKKTWKAFRDRLRLRRAGAAWTSSIHVPASDIPIRNGNSNHHHLRRPLHHHHSISSGGTSGTQRHSLMSKKNSVRFTTVSTLNTGETTPLEDDPDETSPPPPPASASSSTSRPMMTRRSSTRFAVGTGSGSSERDDPANIHAVGDMPPARSFRPQMSRHNSTRFPTSGQEHDRDEDGEARDGTRKLGAALAEERAMSAREAVAAQEAAEAEAAAQAAAEAAAVENDGDGDEGGEEGPGGGGGGGDAPVRMSLMDLLEETDRQMGFEGSRYTVGEDDGEGEDDEDGDDYEEEEEGANGGVEHTCCVCMVRHKGAAFIPCGHTFCRLCSRELWVQRGNCPLCNGFILEILDIF